MSTRSGKRIHNSPNDQPLKTKDVKTERKTRSQKQKENCDNIETVLKKKNYVLRNTSEDDTNSDATSQVDNNRTRKSRRTTLKELVLNSNADFTNNTVKKTRGNKKIENEISDTSQKLNKKSKKKKIMKNHVLGDTIESEIIQGKKKLKKKKTSSGSLVVEDLDLPSLTQVKKGNISMDSFHSAAGSIITSPESAPNKYITKIDTEIIDTKESNKNNSMVLTHENIDSSLLTVNIVQEIEPVIMNIKNKSRKRALQKTDGKSDIQNGNKNISMIKLKQTRNYQIKENELSFKNSPIIDGAEGSTCNVTFEKNYDNTDIEKKSLLIYSDKFEEINDKPNCTMNSLNSSYDKIPDLSLHKKFVKKKSFIEDIKVINTIFQKDTSKVSTTFVKETDINIEMSIKGKDTPTKKKTSKDNTQIIKDINRDSTPFKRDKSKIDTTFEKDTRKSKTSFDKVTSGNIITLDKDISKVNTTFDKDTSRNSTYFEKDTSTINTTFEKDTNKANNTFEKDTSRINTTFEKDTSGINTTVEKGTSRINTTFEKDTSRINTTFEKDTSGINTMVEKGTSRINTTFEKDTSRINTTFEKDTSRINTTFEKDTNKANTTFEKDTSIGKTSFDKDMCRIDTTFDKDMTVGKALDNRFKNDINKQIKTNTPVKDLTIETKLNKTSEQNTKLDTTFDKDIEKDSFNGAFEKPDNISKSSLISSDASNLTDDKSLSRISITSDDSRTENIANLTPVLIESSIDESIIAPKSPKLSDIGSNIRQGTLVESPVCEKSIEKTPPALQREGTFTKESEITDNVTTPLGKSTASPGRTPFPSSKCSSTKKRLLNVTRSIEKSQRLSVAEVPRATRVMFCSPANTPVIVNQTKGKVIKSSMKGSNKSFVFNESVSELVGTGRKRSYTLCDADDISIKRKRLASDGQHSTGRLSRSRTCSASGKVLNITPSKTTPVKSKPENKVGRKKLPNFAALHQKQFDKMESLDECQERKARRARQMLAAAAAATAVSDRDSKVDTSKKVEKKKNLPTLDSINPGYTRFGFKMKSDVNPFATNNDDTNISLNATKNGVKPSFKTDAKLSLNISKNKVNPFAAVSKTALKIKENVPTRLRRQATLPSLAGSTARKEIARQTVMREKSFAERRNTSRQENRTVIKGVRTNRRFELQMQMRNIN